MISLSMFYELLQMRMDAVPPQAVLVDDLVGAAVTYQHPHLGVASVGNHHRSPASPELPL